MKKLLAVMLSALMVLGLCAFTVSADADINIGTWDQLVAWAKNGSDDAGKTVALTADITAPSDAQWTNKDFAGSFDGQGHTISGLKMTSDAGNLGFIKNLKGTGVVENFRLVDSSFTGTGNVSGAIVCNAVGTPTVKNVYTNAVVTGTYHLGGIVGNMSGATVVLTVESCWFDGTVTAVTSYASGIVGNQQSGSAVITDCLNTGTVTVAENQNVSGISTAVYDGKLTATRCVNAGQILQGDQPTGCGIAMTITSRNGLIGEAHLVDCFNLKSAAKTQPSDRRDKAVLDGEVIEFASFGNLGVFAALADNWVVTTHNGQKIIVPKAFADETSTGIPVYKVNEPVISDAEVKAEGHWGPRWTVTLDLPEGFNIDNVKLGVLVTPTKVMAKDGVLLFEETSYEYRGNTYPVANVEGKIVREAEGKLEATFVITELNEKTIRANYTARPYAIYTVPEGNIEVYGAQSSTTFYTNAKLVEDPETKALIDADLAEIDAAIGPDFVVSKDWGTQDVFEEVPALVVDDTTILPAEDKGLTEYTIIVDGTEENYADYIALLEKCGFEKKVDNVFKESVYTAQLTKGDLLVSVTDVSYQNKMFISAMFDQPLSPHLVDSDEWRADMIPGAVNSLHQINLYWWGDSYVIQLKNGHFIIIDGATHEELGNLLDYLESLVPAGTKPVIEAWCNTHLHLDHFHILNSFNTNPDWIDRVYVEGFYFNEPSDAVKDLDKGVYAEIARERLAISKLKTTKGTTPEIYRTYIGQRYYFCDITMDIALSQEMIPLSTYTGGFNDSSNWYYITMDGQTFLEGGDGHQADMRFLMKSYEPEDMQVDFFSVLHHSYNTWDDFTNWVGTFKTILYPTMASEKAGVLNQARHQLLNSKGLEYFFAGDGTDVFYLPYTPGKLGTDGGYVQLPDLPSHKQ